jgi:hypothetical protein
VGDSVIREYYQNCLLFKLQDAGLTCNFENIVLKGQYYTESYATSVASVIAQNVKKANPVVFATNLGMMHVIGHATTRQWRYFVEEFASHWKKGSQPNIVRKVWLGPPTIHYASQGMGAQRARKWDEVAWEVLSPLGFERLDAFTVTASREEASWDGLHLAAERGKTQSKVVHPNTPLRRWNGGVSSMLFAILLARVCP